MTDPQRQGESGCGGSGCATAHMLSFDVEEYFQVEAAREAGVAPQQWDSFQKRLAPAVDKVLALLADCGCTATFFILGWVARNEPEVVRRIAETASEIASHGMTHGMIKQLGPERFRDELLTSRKLLEDMTGRGVIGYRAPTFSLTHETAWAIDALIEAGYRYDSSVFPVRHDRYGVPAAPRGPHRAVGPSGADILEIPPLTGRLLGRNFGLGGGGYLRLFPARLVAAGLQRARRRGDRGMIYVHPWELDPHQPVLGMRTWMRFRHRVNLHKTDSKLRWLARRFRFTSVAEQAELLDGSNLPAYRYGSSRQTGPGPLPQA